MEIGGESAGERNKRIGNDRWHAILLMPGVTHALFIFRRMQEKFREREKKLYICFVDLEKIFDKVL